MRWVLMEMRQSGYLGEPLGAVEAGRGVTRRDGDVEGVGSQGISLEGQPVQEVAGAKQGVGLTGLSIQPEIEGIGGADLAGDKGRRGRDYARQDEQGDALRRHSVA